MKEQEQLRKDISRIFSIFSASEGVLRPHFILTGPSGTGKTFLIQQACQQNDIDYFEVNAAQLTKEGISGNSLSKALSPLRQSQGNLCVCFVDEFDKLFISGNTNSELAHESTNGVQNEFLKILESDVCSVFGDYGKYIDVPVSNVLFIFAGAFNGEDKINLDRLRELGVKTEFLGRVGLVFNTCRISLESLIQVLHSSERLNLYLDLFPEVKRDKAVADLTKFITDNYESNTLGVRMVNTLITQYFIHDGKLSKEESKQTTFQKKLAFSKE
ncbi:MAG: AAA family ATPase [Cetobacterium sp.]|uniref:AAA family ATPase n=1 Tax=Cetobacterium sp. TaxID=2071632 RepID=UPI003EE60ACF